MPLWRSNQSIFKPRAVALLACALLTFTGCRSFQVAQQRSVEDLYFEALKAKPEATLAMDHPLYGQTPTSQLELAEPRPTQSQSPAGAPQEPPSPEASPPIPPIPPASAPPPPSPSPPPNISTVTHLQNSPGTAGVTPVATTPEVLVNELFVETEVREAIQTLATQAKVSVVLDDTVRGSVTCTLENESFETALNRILLPLGLVYRKKDNLYFVGSNDPSSNLFPHIAETIEYKPRNLSTQELLALLPPRQTPFVRMVEKRNVVIIEAPGETARQIHQQLEAADQPIPQIMIEAIVCVVAPDKGLQFGFDWNHGLQVNGIDRLNVGLSGLSFTGQVSPYGLSNSFDDFAVTSAFVKLLAREGYVTIRAAPRVMAKDGEKAEISIARDTFFSISQGNNQFLYRQDIEKVEAGISLMLTPSIRGDNVQIVIEKAEVSEDIRSLDSSQTAGNNPFPIINRRRVTTTVQVKDQQTVVIGGLMQRQTVDRENRIPYLGSMPGIGGVFRKIEKQEQDAEVAIFISPRIVVPTAAAQSQAEPVLVGPDLGPLKPVPVTDPMLAPVPEATSTTPVESPVVPSLSVIPPT